MTLIARIKADQITARKAHNALAASLLTTLLGEAQAIGKNDGNREVTDVEVVAVIKKFIKGMDESISYLQKYDNPEALKTVTTEKIIISAYLPQQMTEKELKDALVGIVSEVGPNMGKVMGTLKSKYEGLYDGKMASTLVKTVIAQIS